MQAPAAPQVRTLLFTDMVDSTHLVERLGDVPAADLFRAHDRIVLDLQQRWRGRLIDRSDGLLLIFERPIDGLGFALDYLRGLRDLGQQLQLAQPLPARAGLHVGEVLLWENDAEAVHQGAKSLEVEGLAKPLAARLMNLARPGQILLSATAEPLAHRAARELGERGNTLVWKSYGRWRFKGVPEAQEVCEVGEPGLAPLRMPAHTPKAWRDLPLWRRPVALAVEALMVVGMAVGIWFLMHPAPALAFNERDWVVVGDLRNLTGDPRLDESLEQAFRLSLEQSHYVNVLSELKVRDTLQRMQQKPDVQVDRGIGSEIAQRDGARALLLPTVAEVGGRLRISAEVIDPRTQTTVYAVMADGRGVESALDSIDKVTGELRASLGEALQNVQKTSVPLPNVSTPSLDALKVFAVARASAMRDASQAYGLYQRALQLDPQFALAHADMGRLHASRGEVAAATSEFRQALAIPQRLSPQEKFGVELMLLQYGTPSVYLRKAQEYLALYPDDFRIIGRLATSQWHLNNDFRAAEALARQAAKPQNDRYAYALYSVGIFLLGQERYDAALKEFHTARQAGFTVSSGYYAYALDLGGQHAQADSFRRAALQRRNGVSDDGNVIVAIDRGRWPEAMQAAHAIVLQYNASGDPVMALGARLGVASTAVFANQADAAAKLREILDNTNSTANQADAVLPVYSTEVRLYLGLLAAYRDDAAGVAQALRSTEGSTIIREYPTVIQLQQVVLAEQERLSGKPQLAVTRLSGMVAHDTALVCVHWALMRAAQATGNAALAESQRQWLATHRGRVFTEDTSSNVLGYFNVAVSAEAVRARTGAK